MSDSAPGEEGFHPLSARKAGEGFSEVLPLHQPIVTTAEPFDRASMLRTPIMEVPHEPLSMPVLTPQPQDGISPAKLTPKSSTSNPPQHETFHRKDQTFHNHTALGIGMRLGLGLGLDKEEHTRFLRAII